MFGCLQKDNSRSLVIYKTYRLVTCKYCTFAVHLDSECNPCVYIFLVNNIDDDDDIFVFLTGKRVGSKARTVGSNCAFFLIKRNITYIFSVVVYAVPAS